MSAGSAIGAALGDAVCFNFLVYSFDPCDLRIFRQLHETSRVFDTMALNKSRLKGKELQSIVTVASENELQGKDCEMDANRWGDLQNHIDLEMVYEKLSFQPFFLLRRVCKRWNLIASDHRGFKDPIPKPYFVSMPFSWSKPYLLACNIHSGQWVRKRLGQREAPLKPPVPAFALHGLLYSSDSNRIFRQLQLYVFDGHINKEYLLPPLPRLKQELSWDGMVVDTSVTPYTFKVIRGDMDLGTQIYDSESNNWTTTPSRPLRRKPPHLTTCANFNGNLYIRSFAPDIIAVYNLRQDVWSELQPPEQLPGCRTYGGSLGTWQGRLLSVVEHHNGERFDSVVVCELQEDSQEWKEYMYMPAEMYNRWFKGADDLIWSSFCEEYVLVVAWLYRSGEFDQPKAVCLCNLATRRWEMFHDPRDKGDLRRSELEASDGSEDL